MLLQNILLQNSTKSLTITTIKWKQTHKIQAESFLIKIRAMEWQKSIFLNVHPQFVQVYVCLQMSDVMSTAPLSTSELALHLGFSVPQCNGYYPRAAYHFLLSARLDWPILGSQSSSAWPSISSLCLTKPHANTTECEEELITEISFLCSHSFLSLPSLSCSVKG